MDQSDFRKRSEKRLKEIMCVLVAKGDEYSREDTFSNFYHSGDMCRCSPEYALFSCASKHIVAVADFIVDLEEGRYQPLKRWLEKTGDIIAYMLLLEAMVEENSNFETGVL